VILGPFDEIRHDQEITGKAHPLDDPQFEVEPLFICLHRRGMGDDGQPRGQPLARLAAQLRHLVLGETRQDRIAPIRPEGTAARDLHSVFQCFGQIGEKCCHLLLRLETMLRRQAAARRALIDIGPLGHAQERIMRLIHTRIGEMHIVGGNQRQVHRIGHFHMAPLGQPLGLGRAALAGVTLQFHIKTVAEPRLEPRHERLCGAALPDLQEPPHRPVRPARQADHPLRMGRQFRHRHMRRATVVAQIEAGIELHQVAIARLVLRQQDHRRGRLGAFARGRLQIGQIHLAAHDRLHPGRLRRHGKLQRGEHVVGVGHRHGGHPRPLAKAGQLLEPHRPFQKRIFGMHAQVDESGSARHARTLAPAGQERKPAHMRAAGESHLINSTGAAV